MLVWPPMFKFRSAARHLPSVAVGLSIALALLAAAAGSRLVTAAVLTVSILLEVWIAVRPSAAVVMLQQAGLGRVARFLLRALSVALVVAWTPPLVVAFLAAVVLLLAAQGAATFLQSQLAKAHASPVLLRNIDVAPVGASPRPTGLAIALAVTELAVLLPALLGAAPWLVPGLALIATALVLVPLFPLMNEVLHNRRERLEPGALPPRLRPLQSFIDGYRPEVLVHLSGGVADTYQINVWLDTLELLDQHVLLLIRAPEMFRAMAPTTLPAACVRSGSDIMSLDLSSATVALFPANVGSNLHILRLPTLMSAFIGHGDSDKSASINPFAKVYDELWVAGEAGASRWRRAGVGVRDDQLVKVGRPQIAAVQHRNARPPGSRPTLLYAPTWEGWNAAQDYCSVRHIGLRLIEAALAHPAHIRVIYKPHPMLGRRDPKVLDAHRGIVRLLNDSAGRDHEVVQGGRSLFDCFNSSDGLATDISSVATDYLASEKPYAVYNFSGVEPASFTDQYPSASAATILAQDGSGIAAFLDIVSGVTDPLATERAALATYLLGPPEMRDREPFKQAVAALSARARREREVHRATALAVANVRSPR